MSVKKFVFVAEGDVFHTWDFIVDADQDQFDMLIAGLRSNPIVVEVTDIDMSIGPGWTFDGKDFTPPN